MAAADLTAAERDTSLLVLAAFGGHSTRAAAALKEQGVVVSARTLRRWRDSDRYRELAQEHSREIEQVATQQMRDFVIAAGEVERAALERTAEDIKTGKVKDAAATLRNLTVAKAVNVDKLLIITGRPSEIRMTETAESILGRLRAKYPGMFIDSTAEEDPSEQRMIRAQSSPDRRPD